MLRVLRNYFARLNVLVFGPIFGVEFTKQRHTRPSTLKAIEVFKDKPIRIIEIGCYSGINARNIIKSLNVTEFVVIDPYEKYDEFPDYDEDLLSSAQKKAAKRLDGFGAKITWIKEYSNDAIESLEGQYDFIYIDGNHEFEFAFDDMKNYFKFLKSGGVMGGHDISDRGVHHAFFKFLNEEGSSVADFGIKEPDWFLIKK
jgi:hypothetical protein